MGKLVSHGLQNCSCLTYQQVFHYKYEINIWNKLSFENFKIFLVCNILLLHIHTYRHSFSESIHFLKALRIFYLLSIFAFILRCMFHIFIVNFYLSGCQRLSFVQSRVLEGSWSPSCHPIGRLRSGASPQVQDLLAGREFPSPHQSSVARCRWIDSGS